MRRKIFLILLIIAIFYIIVGALLLLNIQLIESPDILIEIEVSEINSQKAVLHTIINVGNPNVFDIIAKNFKLVITTQDDYEVANILIEGGTIASNKNKTFIEDANIVFNGHSPEILIAKISGDVGVNVLFIEKTIPIKIGFVTSIENLLNELAAPVIDIELNIDDITTDEINLSALITAYNPNAIDIYLNDISAEIKTDSGEIVGSLDVANGIISGKQYTELNAKGWLLLKALNTKKLFINMQGSAGTNIAGFEKNIPLNITTIVNIPDLEDILLPKENPTVLSIKVDGKATLNGYLNNVTLIINNTLKVDLALRNININLFIDSGGKKQLLGGANIEEELIIEAGKTRDAKCQINIPLFKMLSAVFSADWLLISVSADLTIRGINSAVYLEIEGYQDIHLFK